MSVDIIFFIDIIVIFNTAYLDDDFMLVHDRSVLAVNYLKGWFSIDLVAILPFEIFMGGGNKQNQLAKVTRIGRMYKLVKLTKLLRVLKVLKERSKFAKYA